MGRIDSLDGHTLDGHTLEGDRSLEVDFILSALEAAGHAHLQRRAAPRRSYRVQATLRLYSDEASSPPWVLYTRDACRRGLGFITRHRLPLGYGGVVHLRGPDGRVLEIHCTLSRCRETVNGWFEGALHFNREQYVFGLIRAASPSG